VQIYCVACYGDSNEEINYPIILTEFVLFLTLSSDTKVHYMEKLIGFLSPALVYLCIFMLHILLPGRWVRGYVTGYPSGEKLMYRLNGLTVLFSVVFIWAALCYLGIMPWDWFYEYRWYGLTGAAFIGLVFSFAVVLPFPEVKKHFLVDFFLGRLENPQLWGGKIDAKMWLYLVGAVMLELNVLSFAAHHQMVYGARTSSGIYLSAALLSFFVVDYLTFEEVHLYTYDFVAERVGFKLGWGCLAFYPYFYAVPLWSTVSLPAVPTSNSLLALYGLIFLLSWCLSRGANLQKYYFKKDPARTFLGITPETITDGKKTLLVNGFWGLSRHINYLGEVGMAVAVVLCTGYPLLPWPWLYPLYYIALLGTRQLDDNRRCAQKYGTLWKEYERKVPYRIIPFIY
jgi:protein-S-isoprenylcysteine O-methyltransferase Ste14